MKELPLSSRIETMHKCKRQRCNKPNRRPPRKSKRKKRTKKVAISSKKRLRSQELISVTTGVCLLRPGSKPWKRRSSKPQIRQLQLSNRINNLRLVGSRINLLLITSRSNSNRLRPRQECRREKKP